MTFKPPFNPRVIRSVQSRNFQGLGGPLTQVIRKANRKGWDISSNFSNEQYDLDCNNKNGQLTLRPGLQKTTLTGFTGTITTIFQVTLGGVPYYGYVYDGTLHFEPIPDPPDWPDDPFEFPAVSLPSDWPYTLPDAVKDDVPSPDPSSPPSKLVCEEHETWTATPASLTFTMVYQTPPAIQNWYWTRQGWVTHTSFATYSLPAAWYEKFEAGLWMGYLGPCEGYLRRQVRIEVNGKDSSGNWLAKGTYADVLTLKTSSGTTLSCPITLTVQKPIIAASGNGNITCWAGEAVNNTWTITLTNTGDAAATWTSVITPSAGGSIITLSADSGTLAASGSVNITATADCTTVGTYAGTITFSDQFSETTSVTYDVEVNALPTTLYVWMKQYDWVAGAWSFTTEWEPMNAQMSATNNPAADWSKRWSRLAEYLERISGVWHDGTFHLTVTNETWTVDGYLKFNGSYVVAGSYCRQWVISSSPLTAADDPQAPSS